MAQLKQFFRPEFLNRVDETVLFSPLLENQVVKIVDVLLGRLRKRLAERKIELELSDEAKRFIAHEAYDPAYGARPLKRYLQNELETCLARGIIGGQIPDGCKVVVKKVEDEFEPLSFEIVK